MKLAVIIPAFNEELLIHSTLESLDQQTNLNFETIIVDSNSSDKTIDIVREFGKKSRYKLSFINENRRGIGYARDAGMREGIKRGATLLSSTDADTIVPPNWTQSVFDEFSNLSVGLVAGDCDTTKIVDFKNEDMRRLLNCRSYLFHEIKPLVRGYNFAIRASTFEKIGGIPQPVNPDGTQAPGEDNELEQKVLQIGEKIGRSLSVDYTHPRRYIHSLLNLQHYSGNPYFNNRVYPVRNEEHLVKLLDQVKQSTISEYASKAMTHLFLQFSINVFNDKVLRDEYWTKIVPLFEPLLREKIEFDFATLDQATLISNYKDLFFRNVEKSLTT